MLKARSWSSRRYRWIQALRRPHRNRREAFVMSETQPPLPPMPPTPLPHWHLAKNASKPAQVEQQGLLCAVHLLAYLLEGGAAVQPLNLGDLSQTCCWCRPAGFSTIPLEEEPE